MKDVVIVSACRTAIGTFGGSLKDMIGAKIAAVVMKEAIKRAGIDPGIIDDVRFGCCIEHPNTLNTARVAALWPVSRIQYRCNRQSCMYFGHGGCPFRRRHDQGRYG